MYDTSTCYVLHKEKKEMMWTERRTRFGIMAEILDFCEKPQNKTRIIRKTNTSWNTAEKYLIELHRAGLLNIHNSPIRYHTTIKGQQFLDKWANLVSLIQEEFGDSKSRFRNYNARLRTDVF